MFHNTETRKALVKRSFVAALLSLFLLGGTVFAQGVQKIGYVDTEKLIQQMPEAKQAEAALKKLTDQWEAEFGKLKKDYEESIADYERKKSTMAATAKQQKEEEILKKQQVLQEFQVKKLGRGGELERKQVDLLKPIRDKAMKAIEKIAKQQGYTMVIEKGSVVNVVLYADKANDLTFKVLDELK
ncbi:MAG: OmpH family outer membrane protein [Desulfobulbaceae bacterium]|nr:OmpH family outer membrane protein [Desulfobulbaceae bacterium]